MKKSRLALFARIFGILFIFVILVSAGMGIWLKTGNFSPAKIRVLKFFPLPIAFINKKPVFISDYLAVKNNLEKAGDYNEEEIYAAWVENLKIEAVAANKNAKNLLPASKTALDPIEKFYWEKIALKIYYNSKPELNPAVYKNAQEIVEKAQKENFSSLVKTYSQDEYSKNFEGLSEELPGENLLPEIYEKIKNLQEGEIVIVPSRLGLHIVQINSRRENNFVIRQIFLKTENFEGWLKSQTALVSFRIIIKP